MIRKFRFKFRTLHKFKEFECNQTHYWCLCTQHAYLYIIVIQCIYIQIMTYKSQLSRRLGALDQWKEDTIVVVLNLDESACQLLQHVVESDAELMRIIGLLTGMQI